MTAYLVSGAKDKAVHRRLL